MESTIQLNENTVKLLSILLSFKGSRIVTLVTETDARLKKTNNPYKNVVKRLSSQVIIGFDYESVLKNRLLKEGKEDAAKSLLVKSRKWGTRLRKGDLIPGLNIQLTHNLPLVHHKGEFYIECGFLNNIYNKAQKPEYFYLENGKEIVIDKELIKDFLPAKSVKSSTQDELSKEFVLRDYKFNSIKKIAIDKEVVTL